MRFKIWFEHIINEEDNDLKLSRSQQHLVNRFYDRIVKELIGGDKKNVTMNLSDFEDTKAEPGSPPKHRGSQAVMSKLSPIFAQMKQVGIPDLTMRTGQVENWLQKMSSDQKVGPGAQVKDLLTNLFGKNAVELYGGNSFKASPNLNPQPPQDTTQLPQNGTSPPMTGDAGDNALPDGNPDIPPDMPPGGNPKKPLQSPGGPMPPKPQSGIF